MWLKPSQNKAGPGNSCGAAAQCELFLSLCWYNSLEKERGRAVTRAKTSADEALGLVFSLITTVLRYGAAREPQTVHPLKMKVKD